MRLLDRGEICIARRIEEAVDHALAAVGRQVDRQALLAERILDPREQLLQVDVLGVDLVDDDQAAQSALLRPAHHARTDHLDAVLRVDHHAHGLHRIECTDRLADEIGEARRVEQMHVRLLVLEVQHRGVQRMQEILLERIVIGDGGAALDAAHGGDGTGAMQQRFGKCGLA